jgi:hypothetical protein
LVGAVATRTGVTELRLGVVGLERRALRVELFFGAVAAVGALLADEAVGELFVDGQPLHLKVRPIRAPHLGALGPVDLEPSQGIENHDRPNAFTAADCDVVRA